MNKKIESGSSKIENQNEYLNEYLMSGSRNESKKPDLKRKGIESNIQKLKKFWKIIVKNQLEDTVCKSWKMCTYNESNATVGDENEEFLSKLR